MPTLKLFAEALRAEVAEVQLLTPVDAPTEAELRRAFHARDACVPDMVVLSIAAADRSAGPLLG